MTTEPQKDVKGRDLVNAAHNDTEVRRKDVKPVEQLVNGCMTDDNEKVALKGFERHGDDVNVLLDVTSASFRPGKLRGWTLKEFDNQDGQYLLEKERYGDTYVAHVDTRKETIRERELNTTVFVKGR